MSAADEFEFVVRDGNVSFHRGNSAFSAGVLVYPSGARVVALPEDVLELLTLQAGWKPGLWPKDAS